MTSKKDREKIERLIDANLNRLKEGIRVIEDINRYIYDDSTLTYPLKTLRHKLKTTYNQNRLIYRDIENDIQKNSTESELSRNTINDLVIASFSRAQESSRVLEECFKLDSISKSELFKEIRYELYSLEKSFFLNRKSTSSPQ
jgi:thiamine-phosphate pyrophosphorylase